MPSGAGPQTHTHTDVRTKAISRNQAHAGLWPAHTWFKKEVGFVIKVRKQVASHLTKKLLAFHSTGSIVSDHTNTIPAG